MLTGDPEINQAFIHGILCPKGSRVPSQGLEGAFVQMTIFQSGVQPAPRVHKRIPGFSVIIIIKLPVSILFLKKQQSKLSVKCGFFSLKQNGSRAFRLAQGACAEVSGGQLDMGPKLKHQALSPWDVETREQHKGRIILQIHLQIISTRSRNSIHQNKILKECIGLPWWHSG